RGEKTNGVALIGYSHGEIQLWHVPSAKILHRQAVPPDENARRRSVEKAEEALKEGEATQPTGTRRRSLSSLPRREPKVDDEDDEDGVEIPIGVEALCCAFSGDGEFFAVGASDGVVRVYSDNTRDLLVELKPGIARGSGHSSRIFSVKFHPDDPNIIVSGGW
ncbi:unnamed protein product, partial [Hapterophycus canaliculatus]